MADLEQALDQILSDPDAMEQIMALAGRLGGSPPSPPQEDDPPPAKDTTPPLLNAEQMAQMAKLMTLFQSGGQTDDRTTALLTALRPFLRQEQQQKLDRAMRLAGLSQAARQAYQMWKEGDLHV